MTVAEAVASALERFKSGKLGEAEALCRQVIAVEPPHPDALHILGMIAHQTQHYEAAVRLFDRAIAEHGGEPQYHNNRGNSLASLKRIAEAKQSYRRAIELNPGLVAAHYGLGVLDYGLNDFDAAEQSYRVATAGAPNWSEAWIQLANTLFQQGKTEEAIDCYRRTLALNPDDAVAHSNLGLALYDVNLADESIEHCRRAIELQPDFPAAHNHLSLALLLKGDFETGLVHHEWRWHVKNLRMGGRRFEQPAWRGEPLNGRRILLHPEQGAGDTLQFMRYVPLVAARGGRVVIEVPPDLKRLASSLKGVEQIITAGEPLPAFDQQCSFVSLPLAFGTTMANIPGATPYLAAPAPLQDEWRQRLAADPHPRVGLVWTGNPEQRSNRQRSTTLAALAPLADSGATFYSLQKGPAVEQLKNPPLGMNVRDLGQSFTDFADTAAAMCALDLVISVCTSPAHLAGAIGKPLWLLLANGADWRWFIGREDSPWYPTARLFRQTERGDWAPVVAQVAAELRRLSAGDRSVLVPPKAGDAAGTLMADLPAG